MVLALQEKVLVSMYGHLLLVYKQILSVLLVLWFALVPLVAVKPLLHLLVVTTFVSLVVRDIIRAVGSTMLIICGMVSSVEQSREGVVKLLVYHGSTRHYPLPPVTTLNWGSAVIRALVMKMSLLACMRFMWNSVQYAVHSNVLNCLLLLLCCFSFVLLHSILQLV